MSDGDCEQVDGLYLCNPDGRRGTMREHLSEAHFQMLAYEKQGQEAHERIRALELRAEEAEAGYCGGLRPGLIGTGEGVSGCRRIPPCLVHEFAAQVIRLRADLAALKHWHENHGALQPYVKRLEADLAAARALCERASALLGHGYESDCDWHDDWRKLQPPGGRESGGFFSCQFCDAKLPPEGQKADCCSQMRAVEAAAYGLREVEEEFLSDVIVRLPSGEETTVGEAMRPALAAGSNSVLDVPRLTGKRDGKYVDTEAREE